MAGQIFISLLNPGIGAVLAVAFFLLWRGHAHRTYIAIAACSYAFLTTGFLIQDVGPSWPLEFERVPANLCFLLAACFLSAAVLARYGLDPPYGMMAALVGIAMAGLSWFLLIDPSLSGRVIVINSALGFIATYTAVRLWAVQKTELIDRLLFLIVVLSATNFLLRPLVVAWLVGSYNDGNEGFQRSVYWTTVQFTQAMISIMVALNLLVAVAFDLIADLRKEADTDKLSGLLNRRGFEAEALAALRRSADRNRPVALMIADLDFFKTVNDTYGHMVGDVVIAIVGEHIRKICPPDVIAGRIGGEEFSIVLPGVELDEARRLAEQICVGTKDQFAGKVPAALSPTLSIGLSIARSGTTLSELLGNADRALYAAKRLGRNQVQVFAPGPVLVADRLAKGA